MLTNNPNQARSLIAVSICEFYSLLIQKRNIHSLVCYTGN